MSEERAYAFISHASADNARLRPVILELLKQGVSLWFDKPNHPDIRIDDLAFAGFINGGRSWAGAIDDFALPQSSAFLIFPSEACGKSTPCAHEVFTAMSRHRMTGQRYFIAPLFVDVAAERQMHDEIDAFQGYPTHTEIGEDGLYRLTERGHAEVARLVRDLQARFAEYERDPLTIVHQGVRFAKDDAFLVDRARQSEGVLLALRGAAAAEPGLRRQPLFIIYGMEDEEPRCFGSVTLPRRVLGQAGLARHAKASEDPLTLSWPASGARSAVDFATLMTAALASTLQGADRRRGAHTMSPEDAARVLAGEGIARIAVARLPAAGQNGLKDMRAFKDALTAWARYWGAFPFEASFSEGRATLAPVLEIAFVREGERRAELQDLLKAARDGKRRAELRRELSDLSKRAKLERELRRFLAKPRELARLAGSRVPVELKALDELEPVRPGHADDWVSHDPMFDRWEQADRIRLRRDLKALFAEAAELPMRLWAEKARPFLKV